MKRTSFPKERLPLGDFSREQQGAAESVVFVSAISLICLYLWLMLSLWID